MTIEQIINNPKPLDIWEGADLNEIEIVLTASIEGHRLGFGRIIGRFADPSSSDLYSVGKYFLLDDQAHTIYELADSIDPEDEERFEFIYNRLDLKWERESNTLTFIRLGTSLV